jgi:osmotically-inducible protein OsmY
MKADAQVQQDVMAELRWEPSINAAQIGVEVRDGVLTLSGVVNSFAEKWDAERVAQRVFGVNALAVAIEVQLPGDSQRSDADIARAAVYALEWTSYLPANCVSVMVDGGWITLSGEVDFDFQRQAAARSVRYLQGVKGVSDQVVLRTGVSLTAVKAEIEAALKRRAKSEARQIEVDVKGSTVTLSGEVDSWAERQLAMEAAWGTAGVRSVFDNMSLVY